MKSILIYTDGSSRGNPGPGGWGAIVSIPQESTIELGGSQAATTNNAMELTAIVEALTWTLDNAPKDTQILLFTDSQYAKNGLEGWIFAWMRNDWQTKDGEPVKNQALWQRLIRIQKELGKNRLQIVHVPGHVDIPGNERCDAIATSFAERNQPTLYSGATADYSVDLTPPSPGLLAEKRAERAKTKQKRSPKTGYYLSLVGKRLERHATWAECEARVKGVPGAKFKKVADTTEEAEQLRKWHLQ